MKHKMCVKPQIKSVTTFSIEKKTSLLFKNVGQTGYFNRTARRTEEIMKPFLFIHIVKYCLFE